MATADTTGQVLTNKTRRFLPVWRPEPGAKFLEAFPSGVDLLPGSQEAAFCCVPTWGLGVGRELLLFDSSLISTVPHYICRSLLGLLNRHHKLAACKPQTLTVHGPAGWTSEIQGSGEMSLEATLLGLSTSPSLCILTKPSLCGCLCLGLFSQGHQSYWILAPLPDLTLT